MLKSWFSLLLVMLFLVVSISSFANSSCLPKDIKTTLTKVYQQYKNTQAGKNADYIPELAKVNPSLFGIAIITVDGQMESIGDANVPFAIESISKPFVYALALQDNGEQALSAKVGLNATGHGFNSVLAIEEHPKHRQNAMVNAGAIQVSSLIKGENSAEKWQRVLTLFNQLSASKVYLGQAVYESESATNQHNQAIAQLMQSYGLMYGDVKDAVDRYTKACSIMVTAKQLAMMGATLASGGINPVTHQRVIPANYVRDVLSEMVVNGLYEDSGAWWWTVGLPAKSGVGGGILAVVPNKMAVVVFSPPLDAAGNSIRAKKVIEELSRLWQLHLLDDHSPKCN